MMDKEDFDELDNADLSRERLFVSDAHRTRVVQYLNEMLNSLEARHAMSVEVMLAISSNLKTFPDEPILGIRAQN